MADDSLIQRLLEAVADRESVDWSALEPELLAQQGASPEQVQEASWLRLLDEIGRAHGAFQSDIFGGDTGDTTHPEIEEIADDTLDEWGRYRLHRKVGRGGFGSVYEAWDPILEMSVAIKILHQRYSDEGLKERLLREGRLLAQVNHVNVVRVLNVEQHGGRLGLVMEFLSGQTMETLVAERGVLTYLETSRLVEDVCRALVAVHGNGLLHRDVKARNIIREPDGRVVLMDFGAGLPAQSSGDKGTVVGTPLYMAPELLHGGPATIGTDVYSVGVLLFYLVTGRHPVEGRTIDDLRDAHILRRSTSLTGLRPSVPRRFVAIVERALSADPAHRYPTPAALLQPLVDVGVVAAARTPSAMLRVAIFAALAVLAAALFGGMLSSVAFNVALRRSEYADEALQTWFKYGGKALVLPVVLSLMAGGLVALVAPLRRRVIATSSAVRSVDRRLASRLASLVDRLRLNDPSLGCVLLFVVSAAAAVMIWSHWAPLWRALTSDVSDAPAETLSVLASHLTDHRVNYRVALSLLVAANIGAWLALTRSLAAHRVPASFVAIETALVVILVLSMQVPYRLARVHSEPFETVRWRHHECAVLGERATRVLLLCPRMTPRIHAVVRGAEPMPRVDRSPNLFESFAPAGAK